MGTQEFTKPRLNLKQQIAFLKQQGLQVDNEKTAYHILQTIGYYRLSGYLLPFKKRHNNDGPRTFRPDISLDLVWQLYQFDRELRLLVSDAIEKIEVAFRASIANVTSEEFGQVWYPNFKYYKNKTGYHFLMQQIDKILKDRQETFIQHYLDNYKTPKYPPIWMIVETLSFGTCSKMFTNIKQKAVRQAICKPFNQHTTVIESWMRTLVWIRNLCAHHSRVWNRWLVQTPKMPKDDPHYSNLQDRDKRFIAVAYIIVRLLKEIAPKSPWQQELNDLFAKYNIYPGPSMGFIPDWSNDPFWKL